jgi:TonB family protein
MNMSSWMPMRSRRFISILAILQILTAGAVSALLTPKIFGQVSDTKPPEQSHSPAVTILTPVGGVDFNPFLNQMSTTVKKNWYSRMPESALLGYSGKVVLRFKIQKDGTLLNQTPTIETSSGKQVLDKAAITAIVDSAPFEHLPDSFHGPYIELVFTFLYNDPVDPDRKGPQL